ncbi:hypothetical protein CA13_36000 [Planctomycetes bacterium CA13]|uniref:Peptidase C-terminal archaeal/bacterial domain-containing protein n=1 Tax=Novipirellula herctigrandis TaxID=2527986 RepID=A0A5C5Z431_9BACT|nr:hypothetical protein CA13_36000 [Planctomycetes bacterium CA13]
MKPSFRHTAIFLVAICFASSNAFATFPIVERLSPLGVVRGEESTITLVGKRVGDAHQVLTDLSGITIIEVKPIDNQKVEVKLKADATLAPGLYPIRLVTKGGIANLRLLGVGTMPIVNETEPNSDFNKSQPIELNRTVEGVIDREDVDHFQVKLAAGQTLNAEIEGIRLAYSLNNRNILDPYIAILDERRFEVASSDDSALLGQDGVCSFTATEAGTYTVLVRDSSFGGSSVCGYRLHVGTFPRPVAAIPGGGLPGSTLNAKLIALDGDSSDAAVLLPSKPEERWPVVTENEHGISPSPNWIRVNSLPVMVEQEPNNDSRKPNVFTVPAAFCGTVDQANDFDCFGFECKKGEKYRIAVFSRDVLRSPLDAVVNVFDPNNKGVLYSDDIAGKMDPFLELNVATDGMHTVRIFDHLRGGGPSHQYRIEVTKSNPEFDLSLKELRRDEAQVVSVPIGGQMAMMVTAARRGYNGEINMELAGLPDKVTPTTYPIPAGRPEIPILLTATSDATHSASLFEIAAVGNEKNPGVIGELGQTHKLVAGQNRRVMWGYTTDRAAVAVTDAAPFSIEFVQPKTAIVRNGSKSLVVRINKKDGFDEAVSFKTLYNPPGIGINNSRTIAKGKTEVEIPITANGGAAIGSWPLIMIAKYSTKNGPAEMATPPIMLDIQSQLFKFQFPRATAELGTEAVVAVDVEVLGDLPGKAEVQLVGIPNGVTSPAAVQQVTKETTSLTFPIVVAADAKPGNHKTLVCQARVKVGDEVIVQTVGTGELRVDKPLPPKVEEAPKVKEAPKPVEKKPVQAKPLTRIEQLRQMKKEQR